MSSTLDRQPIGYMKFLTEGESNGSRTGVPVVKTTNARSGSTLLWVGLTAKDVRSMLDFDGKAMGDRVSDHHRVHERDGRGRE